VKAGDERGLRGGGSRCRVCHVCPDDARPAGGEEEMKGIELQAATRMMASGLNSALKGTAARLDPWRKAAEAARRCGSVER
jgi:hypothetical protein